MRIVIDMQGAQTSFSAHRGVGRYTLELTKALLLSKPFEHEFFLALNGHFIESVDLIRKRFFNLLPQDHIKVWSQDFAFKGLDRNTHTEMRVSEIIRESFISSLNPDVVFSTNLQEGYLESAPTSVNKLKRNYITITTLHDVIPLIYKEEYLGDKQLSDIYLEKIEGAKNSDIILAVSSSSRKDIIKYLGVDERKVVVIENAVDHKKFRRLELDKSSEQRFLDKYGLPDKYLLYVGGNDIHKDLDTLFRAYAKLDKKLRQQTGLVLVGKEIYHDKNKILRSLANLGVQDNIFIIGNISDEDLICAYNYATIFVFPSRREGFGLPLLEAMACGVPVLTTTAPSLQEIVNNQDVIFEPGDDEALAEKIDKIIRDENLRQTLSERNTYLATKYSWTNSAEKFIRLLDSLKTTKSKTCDEAELLDTAISHLASIIRMSKFHLSEKFLFDVSRSLDKNVKPQKYKNKLLIDVSAVVQSGDKTGIQRVTRAIASELMNGDLFDGDVVLVFSSPHHNYFYRAPRFERNLLTSELQTSPGKFLEPITFYDGDILLYLDLHPGLAISKTDENRYHRLRGIKVYHVVYDLLPIKFPNFFWPELCTEFEAWLHAITQSSGAICISKATADDLAEWILKNAPECQEDFKISWFHLGADMDKSAPTKGLPPDADKLLAHFRIRRTFLMVGTLEPRKGHAQVLDAFEQLWQIDIDVNLVIVGKQGWMVESLVERLRKHTELGKHLFWMEGISDEYLEKVYEASTCLIAASYGEGFGLPLIEAAMHNTPVIASDIPVFHEVAGDGALYFSLDDPDSLRKAVIKMSTLSDKERRKLVSQIKWLTWKESAENLLNIIIGD
jgi:glycosyltransferase involved in cell wall biosynthesis